METKSRSKEAQKIIKDKLGKFFTEEQLSYLDDLGVEILSDYFSNHELRELSEAPATIIKGFVDRNQKNEVKRRLTRITEDEYESGDLLDWYKQNCSEIEEVYDPQADTVIALEVKHKTLQNSPKVHWDGRFIVAIGDRLAATRNRLDGVVGYQSGVLVQNPQFVEDWSVFHDKREKELKAYMASVKKAKDAHDKKVKKAIVANEKENNKYTIDMFEYQVSIDSGDKALVKNVKKPKEPKNAMPEYVGPAEWVEPERPVTEQFLPPTDSRWSTPETEVISEEHVMSSISNSDIISVKKHIESTGYKKPVTKVKDGYKIDSFILRKVK